MSLCGDGVVMKYMRVLYNTGAGIQITLTSDIENENENKRKQMKCSSSSVFEYLKEMSKTW